MGGTISRAFCGGVLGGAANFLAVHGGVQSYRQRFYTHVGYSPVNCIKIALKHFKIDLKAKVTIKNCDRYAIKVKHEDTMMREIIIG